MIDIKELTKVLTIMLKTLSSCKTIFAFSLLLLPLVALADGGGPMLMFISLGIFSVGQIWILLSKYIYLIFLFKKVSKPKLFWWNVLMNLISTAAGLLFAAFVTTIGMIGIFLFEGTKFKTIGSYLFALGTIIAGDNSPHVKLAISSTIIGFIITYFITVYVEYAVV